MTEEKYEEKVLKALNQLVEQTKPKPPPVESSEEHGKENKESAIEHIDSCPTCRNQFKEKLRPEIEQALRPALLKELKAKLKSQELVTCSGCGEIVEKTVEECPSCHGRKAH